MKRDMGAIRMGIRSEWLSRERDRCVRIRGVFIVREPIGGCPKHTRPEAAKPDHATWDSDSPECSCLLSTIIVDDGEPRPKVRLGQSIKWLR